ncbi:hypothetical protein SAY86_022415 [Trapa natans]|uniref:Uncharacterized protein n=1 Tax=Trapa natans TaxID=22666 RepID=A0AAN7M923_TRANT|nr:hypothetical protein SAY86_022415 [Trapa natans]
MNMLVSECSSGCESGWTLYLEQSVDDASHRDIPPFTDDKGAAFIDSIHAADEVEEEEEEDLSMVSDASSGPPHLHEEEDQHRHHHGECFSRNIGGGFNKKKYSVAAETEGKSASLKCRSSSKRKKKVGEHQHQHHPSLLDDTASSPLNNFFPNEEFVLPGTVTLPDRVYSNDLPGPDFEGRSAFQHHFGTLQPSFSSHQFQKNNQLSNQLNLVLSTFHLISSVACTPAIKCLEVWKEEDGSEMRGFLLTAGVVDLVFPNIGKQKRGHPLPPKRPYAALIQMHVLFVARALLGELDQWQWHPVDGQSAALNWCACAGIKQLM